MISPKRHLKTSNWVYVIANIWMGFSRRWTTMEYSFEPANVWVWKYDWQAKRWDVSPPKQKMMVVGSGPGHSGTCELDVSTS